ncbi:MAG: hypothetical protein WA064_01315 [Candidatus Moraniibacteriota bacterium]
MMNNIKEETKKEIEELYTQCEKELGEIEKEKQAILDRLRKKVAQKKLNQAFEKKHE